MKKSSLYTNIRANQFKMAIFLIGFLLIAAPGIVEAKLISVGTASDIVSFGNNVGIGSTAPNQILHIFDKVSSYATINIEGPTDTADKGAAILFNEGNGATQWNGGLYGFKEAYDGGSNYLYFEGFANGTSQGKHLSILRTGNVGIGLTNPGTKLDVTGALRNSLATTHTLLGGAGNAVVMTDNTGSLFSMDPTTFAANAASVSTLYHIKKWFTPQTGQTVSSSGTTVTMANPVSNYQFLSSMVGAKLTINGESRIITAYTSSSVVTVDSAYSTNYSAISESLWGVYSRAVNIASDGSIVTYSEVGYMAIQKRSGDTNVYIPYILDQNSKYYFTNSNFLLNKDYPIKWSNSTSYSGSSGNDVGLRRSATGTLEIFDGQGATPGTTADYRDLNLRSLNPITGNIGIGTTTAPMNKLVVVSDQSGGGVIKVQNTNIASWSSYEMFDYAGVHKASFGYANPNAPTVAGLAHFSTSDDTPFIIAIHDLEKVRFTTDGHVGIGETNPGSLLTIGAYNTAASTSTASTSKQSLFSVDNMQLSQLEGGAYFGRVGLKENQFGLNNYGGTWTAKGGVYNFKDFAMSSDGKIQTAVTAGNYIYLSNDYGNTWTAKDSARNWESVAMSSDGKIQTAVVWSGNIYVSYDYGNTWTAKDSARNWNGVDVSADGRIQTAVSYYGGYIYVSYDYGNTWAQRGVTHTYSSVAMSSDGRVQAAAVGGDGGLFPMYVSYDYGNTWTATDVAHDRYDIAMSADGKIQTAVVGDNETGYIRVSYDYGATWAEKGNNLGYSGIAMSADGKIQTATAGNIWAGGPNYIYVSTDYGNTWTQTGSSRVWWRLAMSADGKIQTAGANNSNIYVSYADSYLPGGNLGIGVTNPTSLLSLQKDQDATTGIQITNTATGDSSKAQFLSWNGTASAYFGVRSTTFSGWGAMDANDAYMTGDDDLSLFTYTAGKAIKFGTGNGTPTERMRITDAGNVGIGTTTPVQKLDVLGNIRANGLVQALQVGGNSYMFTMDAANGSGPRLQLGNLSTPDAFFEIGAWGGINNFDSKTRDLKLFTTNGLLYITNTTGNVGIGTTDPYRTLQLAASNAILRVGPYYSSGGDRDYVDIMASATDTKVSSSNERFHIENLGGALVLQNNAYNVGIGNTNPVYKLDVNGTVKLGTAGGAFTAMGTCTIASTAITTTKTNYTCTGVPASTAVAVSCSGSAAQSGTGVLYCRSTGAGNQVACNTSATNTTAMTWTCMWVQP